jgi:hypothetical protein
VGRYVDTARNVIYRVTVSELRSVFCSRTSGALMSAIRVGPLLANETSYTHILVWCTSKTASYYFVWSNSDTMCRMQLANSIQQNPSWRDENLTDNQYVFRLLVFIRAGKPSLFWWHMNPFHSLLPCFLTSILIVSCICALVFRVLCSLQALQLKTLYQFLIYHMHATYFGHAIFLDLIILTIFGKD